MSEDYYSRIEKKAQERGEKTLKFLQARKPFNQKYETAGITAETAVEALQKLGIPKDLAEGGVVALSQPSVDPAPPEPPNETEQIHIPSKEIKRKQLEKLLYKMVGETPSQELNIMPWRMTTDELRKETPRAPKSENNPMPWREKPQRPATEKTTEPLKVPSGAGDRT